MENHNVTSRDVTCSINGVTHSVTLPLVSRFLAVRSMLVSQDDGT
jgi:hypothetical protein